MPAVCAARRTVSRKPAILPRTVHHRRSRHATAPRLCNPPDPAAAREPSQLSTWPGGKAITESNQPLPTRAKYPPFCRGLCFADRAVNSAQIGLFCRLLTGVFLHRRRGHERLEGGQPWPRVRLGGSVPEPDDSTPAKVRNAVTLTGPAERPHGSCPGRVPARRSPMRLAWTHRPRRVSRRSCRYGATTSRLCVRRSGISPMLGSPRSARPLTLPATPLASTLFSSASTSS